MEKEKDILLLKEKSGWSIIDKNEENEINKFANNYINYLNKNKTERENVNYIEKIAKENGFISLEEFINQKEIKSKKVFFNNKNKSIFLAVINFNNLENGFNIVSAHLDSPRLDLKQNPVYEDNNLAYLKTHYYGGIKKYHWLNIPLAIHGRIVKEDGGIVDIIIGEEENEPIVLIPDLLPHLSRQLSDKKIREAYKGEDLNIIIGNIPFNIKNKDIKEKVKYNILSILHKKYGIKESDFQSAELEIVPALKAREAGLDRSFIAGYGHDDRSSVFALLEAIIKSNNTKRNAIALFVDKEEIGSEGNSSIQSRAIELFISEIIDKIDKNFNDKKLRKSLYNSFALSADVDAGYDPNYKDVFDIRNTGKMGNGVILTKFTGHGGKYDANDANAEYVGKIRKLFNENNIIYQFGSLGKVDEGGGGTVAKYLANLGMEIIDCGTPVLGMHSPYELISKLDLYQTYKAFYSFFTKFE